MSADPRFPLILAHGQLMTPEVWARVLPALDRVAAVQFAPVFDASIDAMAERLLAEAPARFDLVGYAMGGFVALAVMRLAPDRVRRLALVATLAENDNAAQRERRAGYARLVEAGRFDEVARERVGIVLGARLAADPAARALLERMAADTGADRFLTQQQAILDRQDARPDLPAIAAPTLILRGADDAIAGAAHQADLAEGIAHAERVELPDCGHLIPVEAPDRLAATLVDWLAR